MRPYLIVFISIILFCFNSLSQVEGFQFVPDANYNSEIPPPKSILGYDIGTKPLRYGEIIHYLKTLDEKSEEVQLVEFGKTYEERSLVYLIITSKNNFSRIEEIKNSIAKLSDPRKINSKENINQVFEKTPAVVWLGYGIHGDELSGPDAAVQLAYHLVANNDEVTKKLKDELIILIDPMQNPDGRERYLTQMQQWKGEIINSDAQSIQHTGLWPWGRGNHYLFDMNRDWFLLVHPETQARVKTILSWNPQVFVDAHEMGSFDTYLFSPAGPPLNPNMNEFNHRWRKIFSQDQAKAFDQYGWSYYTREWNDEWYPGYGSGWSLYIGAIGILYEQAQTDGSIVKRPDGTYLNFRDAVHRQFVSSLENLKTTSKNRKNILQEYFDAKKNDMTIKKGDPQSFIFVANKNITRLNDLIEKLLMQNIEVEILETDIRIDNLHSIWEKKLINKNIPKGSFIVNLDQPMGRLAKTILEFDPRIDNKTLEIERKKLEKEKQSKMYDVTAWSLPIAYDVECYWTDNKIKARTNKLAHTTIPSYDIDNPSPKYGYIFEYSDDSALKLLSLLLEKGYKVRSAREPFTIEGISFERGSILIRLNENPESIKSDIILFAKNLPVKLYGVNTALSTSGPDLGGNDFILLEKPKVAIVTGPQISLGSFSTIWHLIDAKIKMNASILNVDGLQYFDLRKYNVLILPSSNSPQTLSQILGKEGINKLKKWIENGGTLIGIANSAAFLADTSTGISKVRLRHQALNELNIYNDEFKREKNISNIKIDSVKIWDSPEANQKPEERKSNPDLKTLEIEDEYLKTFMPRGAILALTLDQENWLTFGMKERCGAIVYSSNVFLSKQPIQTAARFKNFDNIRLSGLLWPEARRRWENSAYLTREAMGNGQIILFAGEPNFRGYFFGTQRMLLNSILLGPGWGTNKVVDLE